MINNKIKIFFILENKNEELINLLKEENIENIFLNSEIDLPSFIINLKNDTEKNLNEEIEMLKNIIDEKNKELLEYKYNNSEKRKKKNKKNRNNEENRNKEKNSIIIKKNTIAIIGDRKSGKSLIIRNFKNILKEETQIIFKEFNYNYFFSNNSLNFNYDILIFIVEMNLEKIEQNKKIINKLILENKLKNKNINIILNKKNRYSINKKIAKKLLNNFCIIGEIKLNPFCDFSYNDRNKYKKQNKKLKKEYIKIINNLLKEEEK